MAVSFLTPASRHRFGQLVILPGGQLRGYSPSIVYRSKFVATPDEHSRSAAIFTRREENKLSRQGAKPATKNIWPLLLVFLCGFARDNSSCLARVNASSLRMLHGFLDSGICKYRDTARDLPDRLCPVGHLHGSESALSTASKRAWNGDPGSGLFTIACRRLNRMRLDEPGRERWAVVIGAPWQLTMAVETIARRG